MKYSIPNGVYPTMITPYTKENKVDYGALGALVDWYIDQGVAGLFAVCQSSEMLALSLEERTGIARFVKERCAGRIPVIASGHISEDKEDQIVELKAMRDTGIDAVVLISGRVAKQNEDDEMWKRNSEIIMKEVADVLLGIYECPAPYKRLMSPEMLKWCADTGRFVFLKDTCCDIDQIREKCQAVQGTNFKIYNANASSLLESLKLGCSGFSGIMANFHPNLYVWLIDNWENEVEKAEMLQNFLGMASLAEGQKYTINAKYHLQLEGVPVELYSRTRDYKEFGKADQMLVRQLNSFTRGFVNKWLKL